MKILLPVFALFFLTSCVNANNSPSTTFSEVNELPGMDGFSMEDVQQQPGKVMHTVKDPAMGNIPALYVETPAHYNFQGEILWKNFDGIIAPTKTLLISDPQTKSLLRLFPDIKFSYQRGPLADQTQAYAQQMGIPFSNNVPQSASQVLYNIVVPALQQQYDQIQVISVTNIPDILNYLYSVNTTGKKVPGAEMILQYTFQGKQYKCAAYSSVWKQEQESSGLYGMEIYGYWGSGGIFTIHSPVEDYSRVRQEYLTIMGSMKNDEQWLAAVRKQDEALARQNQQNMNAQNNAFQDRMRQNQQNFEQHQRNMQSLQQTYDQSNQSWRNNQNLSDQSHSRVIDGIREEQNFYDPNTGQQHKLSNQNQYQWYNQHNNQYIGTDDPGYNPNLNHTGPQYYQLQPEE